MIYRRQSSMSRSRLQSKVGLGNPGLLTPDRAGSVQLLDEPAMEQVPLMEEDRSSTDSDDSEEETKVQFSILKVTFS